MRDGHGLALGLAPNPTPNYYRCDLAPTSDFDRPLDLYALERQAGGIEPGEFALKRARIQNPGYAVTKIIKWGVFLFGLAALLIGGAR